MSDQPQQPQQPKRIAIEMPKDLQAVYSNAAIVSVTPAEILVDFAQVMPRMPKGQIVARVILSPMHAKLLQRVLAQNVAKFESQFGEIRIPTQPSVADQFFRFAPSDEDDQPE